jgi:glyoxylase-like metal-dependent hydrolase (beta-lactamase superfamily II)
MCSSTRSAAISEVAPPADRPYAVRVRVVPGLYMGDCTQRGRAWLLAEGVTCVLFDTGAPDGTLGVGELIQSAGRRPHEIRLILLTHHHRGHAGNAADLRDLTGAQLAASAETVAALAEPPPPRRRFPWLLREAPMRPAHADRVLEPGEVLDIAGGIEVIDAPGHAPGALAFHLRRPDALVCGDALRVSRSGIGPPPSRRCHDPGLAARTAEELLERSARVIAPGHGYAAVGGAVPAPTLAHIRLRDSQARLRDASGQR